MRVRCRTVEMATLFYRELSPTSKQSERRATLPEVSMTQRVKRPAPIPVPTAAPTFPQPPEESKRQIKPTEPLEVLGRHKNDGQKGHKGAR